MNKVLITGEHRSGTTLLAKLLDAQPGVTVRRDFLHLARYREALDTERLSAPLDEGQRRRLLALFGRDTAQLGFTMALRASEFADLVGFYRLVLERSAAPGDVLVGHKSTRAYPVVAELLATVPALRVVFCVRDPRAAILSELRRLRTTAYEPLAGKWREAVECLAALQSDAQLGPRVLQLRYEDLVTEPAAAGEQLTEFLELLSVDTLNALRESEEPWHGNSSFGERYGGIDPAPRDRWRRLDPELGRAIGLLLAEPMRRLGYTDGTEHEERQ